MSEPPPAPGGGRGRALPALVALAAAGLLLWQLAHVLLMAFAAILVALLLRAFAELIGRWLPVGEAGALVLAGLAIAAVLGGFAWVLGAQLLAQATELLDRAPELVRNLEQRLGVTGGEAWLAGQAQDAVEAGGLLGRLLRVSASLIGGVAAAFLVVIGGIHLAVRPRLYRQGVLLLLPPRLQGRAAAALDAVARALKLWLLGQLVAMLLVGCLTTLGLWLLGVPSALALGFMAGMSEFVPVVGPIAAAVPAVALALAEDVTTALWVAGLYFLVQQVESALITPLVQYHAVRLPPALTILAIVSSGVLFGLPGVLLATPLAVVGFVAVKQLWVRDALGQETVLPGES